jgi:hypothetical protein
MRPAERREVIRLLGSIQRFEVTEQVAWRAATLTQKYRRSHSGIGLGDYLIAATALTEGLELATLGRAGAPVSMCGRYDVAEEGSSYTRLSSSTGIVRTPSVWRAYSANPG